MSSFGAQLDALEGFYGRQLPAWPVDPYEFLIWWNCGYPPSEVNCSRGWSSLCSRLHPDPGSLLKIPLYTLAALLQKGGVVSSARATRLKEFAARIAAEFGGDLSGALTKLNSPELRKALKRFHGVSTTVVDRLILFGGLLPVASVSAHSAHVAVRMQLGRRKTYDQEYRTGCRIIEQHVPPEFDARQRAFLLLNRHSHAICNRSLPQCGRCPVAGDCACVSAVK